jgi:hypothetical protein
MKKVKGLIFLSFVFVFSHFASAAPPPPPGGSAGPPCWPPPCIPVDGGVSFLIVAGAAYGAKKIYDSRKKAAKHS